MKVLVVVDMQNDFITGPLGTPEAQEIVPKVVAKIEEYKKNGDPVIFTMDTHYPDYLKTIEGQKLPVEHCIKYTDGWVIHPDILAAYPNFKNHIREKTTFGANHIATYMQSAKWDAVEAMGITDEDKYQSDFSMIEIVGLCTDICVISNAMIIKSEFPDVPIIVDSSCCAGTSPASHQRALEAMKMCHIDIV